MKPCSKLVLAILVSTLPFALAACSDDGGADTDAGVDAGDTDSDSEGDTGTGSDTSTDADGVTAATPEVGSALLTASHVGWNQANCLFCHEGAHNGAGYLSGQCAVCHGGNGAPGRPTGHGNETCAGSSCHDGAHEGMQVAREDECRTCHKYVAPAAGECSFTESYDVVVIGAGGGGLGAAAYLARNGMNVAVLEKHYKVGGYMVSFERAGYRFEASLHSFDGMDPAVYDETDGSLKGTNIPTFEALGIYDKVTPVKGDPMYKALFPSDGTELDIPADPEVYKAELKEMFPAEAAGIDGLFQEMYDIDEVMRVIFGFQNQGKDIEGDDFQEFIDEINERGLFDMLMKVQAYMSGTTLAEFMAPFITDERLIGIWTTLAGFAGGSPDEVSALFFIAMWNNYHIAGFYYFEGGSQSVSDAMAEVVEENGGVIRLGTLATKIDIEGGVATRVRTDDGGCYEARYVVSNANARSTLLDMVGAEHLPDDPASPFQPSKIEAGNEESLQVGMSIFNVYLGVDYDYTAQFDGTHEIMVAESYDQGENFASYVNSEVDEVGLALLNYGIVDPGVAPAGKNAIVITTILMYDWQDAWKWDEGHEVYQQLKWETAMRLVERAEEFLPDLSSHIEVMEVGSPQTMKGFTLNPAGSIFGWHPSPEQSLNNRMPQQTPIDNLLLAGAWTFPGGGQSAVITSGLLAGQKILKKEEAAK